jgi:hypothetical protein
MQTCHISVKRVRHAHAAPSEGYTTRQSGFSTFGTYYATV